MDNRFFQRDEMKSWIFGSLKQEITRFLSLKRMQFDPKDFIEITYNFKYLYDKNFA